MRVRFWGTRGSIASPGPGTVRFGGNTSCVELVTSAGVRFIFDCGTGARPLGGYLAATAPRPLAANILLGHTHWDHIQGFPFFAPVFMPGNQISVYAPKGAGGSLGDVLSGQMEYTYFPVELSQLPAAIQYFDLSEGTHEIGGVRVLAQYLNHPTVTLGYRVEADGVSVLYLTDHEMFSEVLWRADGEPGRIESILHAGDRRHAEFMLDADLVIHDAQYTPEEYPQKKNWGHSTYAYVAELAAAARVRKVALMHHDPMHDDAFLAGVEEKAKRIVAARRPETEIFCAYEGCDLAIEPAEKSPAHASVGAAAVGASGTRVLIADDDPDMRTLVIKVLSKQGYQVSEALNGREALQRVRESRPDLLILDVLMPEMDGMEVLKALRADPATERLPVLMLTSMNDEGTTRQGFDSGATDYLTKPFSIPQLTARTSVCLARAASASK